MSGKLTQEQREHIDRLCEVMDREHIPAGMRFPSGKTMLDECREMWIEHAQRGLSLPEHWYSGNDRIEKNIQKRFEEHGTREWRKAYPADHVRDE